MPNYCSNTLEVVGSAEDFARWAAINIPNFAERGDEAFSFDHSVPEPEDTSVFAVTERCGYCNGTGKRTDAIAQEHAEGDPTRLDYCNGCNPDRRGMTPETLAMFGPSGYPPGTRVVTPGWYRWRVDNWGCKWDAGDVLISAEETHACISFTTAWAPPEQWFKTMSERWPTLLLRLSYDEPGMGFAGRLTWSDGVGTHEEMQSVEAEGW